MAYKEKLKDPRWQKKRLEVFKRDGWKCTECGREDLELHLHHEEYFNGEPWDVPEDFLKTLCHVCHSCVSMGIDFSDFKNGLRSKYNFEQIGKIAKT